MSLKHIKQRREPVTFGDNLNVLLKDTYINGNLDIQGSVNGTSSQGQNTNNTWTGLNEYSVYRPTTNVSLDATGLQDAVSKTFLDETLTNESIVKKGATWTGTNAFSLPISLLPTYILPTNATDAVCGKYIQDSWSAKGTSYLTLNNNWTNSNTFSKLPTCLDPLTDTSIATKNFTDTDITNITQGRAITTASQVNVTDADWGATCLAVQVQIIGGGGGSTSSVGTCVCSSAGVSGGSGSQASLIILTDVISALTGSAQGLFTISVGGGGKAGSGCGTNASSGAGGATNLFVTPKSGSGLNPTQVNFFRANAGGGFGGYCGEAGNSAGGTYSAINSLIVAPYSSSNGRGGSQCAGNIPQYYGIDSFGWGARGSTCLNGSQGGVGGYGLTSYLG